MATDKENSEIDLKKILLPKKEGVLPAPTQRINAGMLLEQEQKATLPKSTPEQKFPPPPPKKEEPGVRPLETYRGDIEEAIQKKNVSIVSIAAAEAARRAIAGQAPKPEEPAKHQEESHDLGLRIAAIAGGVVLLTAAAGLLAFIFLRPQANAPVQNNLPAPFISIDQTQVISLSPNEWSRESVMAAALDAREKTALSLGLMARLYLTQATTTAPPSIAAQTLLVTLAPEIPAELLGSLSGEHILGVHSFDGNQAFLILDVERYEGAYAGMLAWEWSMERDLAPLFTRTPRPRIPEENIAPPVDPFVLLPGEATSTATSTPAATSTQVVPSFLRTVFIDRIVENRDARVIQNSLGDILLLWTFLDRNTIAITTNEYTLREIISRLSRPPVVPLP